MGLFDRLRNELIDIVEFIDNSHNTIVYRFQRHQNEIKNGAKLIVREGQQAIFVNEGQIADIFEPGTYKLTTQNLPILSTLKGWKYGFNSPFKAEVYFVNTTNFLDQKWGTKSPIIYQDERFGMIEICAFGTYAFRVRDSGKFIKEIVGTSGNVTTYEINNQLRSIVVTRFSDAVGEAHLPIEKFAANLNELSKAIFGYMHDDFHGYGMNITKFLIENISMPDEVKKEIFELSRLDKIDINKLTQMKASKAMETAAGNPSGMSGIGVGMGTGFAVSNQMVQAMSNNSVQSASQLAEAIPPVIKYYAVVDGKQAGPYDKNKLKELVDNKVLSQSTLLWKSGLKDWIFAKNMDELSDLWSATPPPLPE